MPFSSPTPPCLPPPPPLYPHPFPSSPLSPFSALAVTGTHLNLSMFGIQLAEGRLAHRQPLSGSLVTEVVKELKLLAKLDLSHLLCLLSWPFCVWYHFCVPLLFQRPSASEQLTLLCLKTIPEVTGFSYQTLLGLELQSGYGSPGRLSASLCLPCMRSWICRLFQILASLQWGQRVCDVYSSAGRLASASGQPERENWSFRSLEIDKGGYELKLGERGFLCGPFSSNPHSMPSSVS